jgi:hypothetical protein
MLNLTLATTFEAGTNLKGTVAGANWLFLLPSLELGGVVCVGVPVPSALLMVSRFARDVAVICKDEQQCKTLSAEPLYRDNRNISLTWLDRHVALRQADSTVNLVWIANKGGLSQLSNSAALLTELRRVLAPDGAIYLDPGGLWSPFAGANGRDDLVASFGPPQRLWLTPFAGEMQTAVPVQDKETIERFLNDRLYSHSMGYGAVRTFKRLAGGKRAVRDANVPSGPRASSGGKSWRTPLRSTMRSPGQALMRSLGSAERFLVTRFPTSRRYGAFLAGDNTELTRRPPLYLRSIAREAGFDIDNYRWGLSARGAYNTRKVLIFLFAPESDATGGRSSDLVVKIVREPSLNYRLENEFQALRQLSETGFSGRGNAPRAAFFGRHRGLAVVGETMIQGSPFLQRTRATAECEYARSAIEWITDLGAETANSTLASPAEAAGVMEKLFDRFAEIYRPAAPDHEFLAQQIATIGRTRGTFPLVFQHGDPGTWNAVVTSEDRVTFLDWEAAEPEGMPLWDLFYFQRSYCMVGARKNGIHDRQAALGRGFLRATPFNRQLVESTKRYCEEIGLAAGLVEPLFFTCWMHRALKEAASLSPARLDNGHYVNLLRYFIENRHSEALGRLFSSGPESGTSGHSVSVDERVVLT